MSNPIFCPIWCAGDHRPGQPAHRGEPVRVELTGAVAVEVYPARVGDGPAAVTLVFTDPTVDLDGELAVVPGEARRALVTALAEAMEAIVAGGAR